MLHLKSDLYHVHDGDHLDAGQASADGLVAEQVLAAEQVLVDEQVVASYLIAAVGLVLADVVRELVEQELVDTVVEHIVGAEGLVDTVVAA